MATESFSYFLKKISICSLILFLSACSSFQKNEETDGESGKAQTPGTIKIPEALRPSESQATPEPTIPPIVVDPPKELPSPGVREQALPKIGIIFGPGSARTLAEIGVIQELTKAKLPISHIAGIEWGALIGAVYAQKAQPFDVEWQMSKLKEAKALPGFLQGVFGNHRVEDLKLSFGCPSYNLLKSQSFFMNRGLVSQMIPFCMPVPPAMRPHNGSVAAITELRSTIDYLRAKGANYIVYIGVLAAKEGIITGGLEDESNFIWNTTALSLQRQLQGVDYVIQVPVQDFDLKDWGRRRELIQKGIEAGQQAASQISRKLGL